MMDVPRTYRSLLGRLKAGGVNLSPAAREAILPDWWDESCEEDVSALQAVELRLARYLNVPLAVLADPSQPIQVRTDAGWRLRTRAGSTDGDAAIAAQVGRALLRAAVPNRRAPRPVRRLPEDPMKLRDVFLKKDKLVELETLLTLCDACGILVLKVDRAKLPEGKAYQGLAWTYEDVPCILLAEDQDTPARVAFHLAHEIGHHALGHVAQETVILDEDEGSDSGEQIEKAADRYALRLIYGAGEGIQFPNAADASSLAREAKRTGIAIDVAPGSVIEAWARGMPRVQHRYAIATTAHQLAGTGSGARALLAAHNAQVVDIEQANDVEYSMLSILPGLV